MGMQGFQDYIDKHCQSAVVPVELQKLAQGSLVGGGWQQPPQTLLCLPVNANDCLHCLYSASTLTGLAAASGATCSAT